MNSPKVSIIIVHWNTAKLLRACVQSILRQKNISYEIIVVDNNSSIQEVGDLPSRYSEITWIQNKTNVGFAAANNQGIAIAKGEHTLLLNPDTELLGNDFLFKLVENLVKHRAGIIGPKLVYPNGKLQPSVRNLPTPPALFFLLSKLHVLFPGPVNTFLKKDFLYNVHSQVGQVSGACFLISSACKSSIGLLDDSYWIWFEEVDYCKRANKAGFSVWYTPEATCMHVGGSSFSQVMPLRRQWEFTKSALRYAHKHFGLAYTILCLIASPIGILIAALTPKRLRQLSYRQ